MVEGLAVPNSLALHYVDAAIEVFENRTYGRVGILSRSVRSNICAFHPRIRQGILYSSGFVTIGIIDLVGHLDSPHSCANSDVSYGSVGIIGMQYTKGITSNK